MRFSFRLYCISTGIIFLAWIAKMHFIFGGDYLFRIGTIGVLTSFLFQIPFYIKHSELRQQSLTRLYVVNSICLFIAYLGMMLKVSHIMNTQFEKDLVLDFIGIPALVISQFQLFTSAERLIHASRSNQIILMKYIVMPWVLFLVSFLLYSVYSVILTTL